jgi:hypothetical protein
LSAYHRLISKIRGSSHHGYLQHLVAVHYERLVLPLLRLAPPSQLASATLELINNSRPCTLSPEQLREVVQRVCRRAADAAAGSAEQASCLSSLRFFSTDVAYPGALSLCLVGQAAPLLLPHSLSVQHSHTR